MSDNRNICVFDLETNGRDTTTVDILQIGAVIIDRNSLKIKDEFNTLVKPDKMDSLDTKEAKEALEVNKITKEKLADAPNAVTAFPAFASWIQKHNIRKDKSSFGAPVASGWGIDGFDLPIFSRYCKKYGYWDNKWGNQNLLNPVFTFDIMKHIWLWTRTNQEVENIKLPTVLEYMGVPKDEIITGAHDALWDVKWAARIGIKLLTLGSYLTEIRQDLGTRRLELKGCMAGIKI
jgi:DNA polymerase III epsilon subunit-like protein